MSLFSLKFALNITLECLTLIFEQTERPNRAKYESMPVNAIDADLQS